MKAGVVVDRVLCEKGSVWYEVKHCVVGQYRYLISFVKVQSHCDLDQPLVDEMRPANMT